MFPLYFKSQKRYDTYLKCLSNIEIGDKVECLIGSDGRFLRPEETARRLIYRIILPIIGKSKKAYSLSLEQQVYYTAVGVSETDALIVKQAYEQLSESRDRYGIRVEDIHLKMYCNSSLDIIYSKIIKRKK